MKICCVAALLLAGCSFGGVQPPVPRASLGWLAARSLPHYVAPPQRPDGGPSWIAPGVDVSTALLYVSDWDTNDVFIYNYASKTLTGKLTGLREPYGQCIGATGQVWIAEAGGFAIAEYAHAAEKPTKRLQTTGYPIGCAVNHTNGDLAVSNFTGKSGAGSVQIWKGGTGQPTTHTLSALYYLWPPAYDDKGNLFVEGQAKNGLFSVAELIKGGGTLHTVSMPGATIHFAGAALWDGKYVGITDQNSDNKNTTVIFRTTVANFKASIVGRIHLNDDCSHDYADVMQPFVVPVPGSSPVTIVGANVSCSSRFDFWPFPSGGRPKVTLQNAPLQPLGQSVSRGSLRKAARKRAVE
ncbi:MAG TPA: hypothetical protein VHR97_07110 [Candidatus Baltobacteraceae bacterium]|jgi:hypothetical protein|nr:hypothetical protein [Candidatus Baltobacteraceae bacterium]